ncbi:spore germination protein [Peribacillus psychrosaccharolyticus]|uniref:Spore germination protein n=1 Tax=Peribacillus psychrosaccharolyticus TaxID=1407 RepID=A0A974NQC8_PERPY|nr:spore germination protein [Peribacillus psychrosaccharolyticus]MEC2055109.1 spore germination protein [Peribacillus psychrosaccharolyticus]MED3743839.1 spore germination protein [Peribacillus psychrosaccharolyticus]QQT01983.1 spore germination protein [Peribacillus psychrosaccharolyticus]
MFGKKRQAVDNRTTQTPVSLDGVKKSLTNMNDAQIDEHETISGIKVNLIYIKSLVDNERLNEAIVKPLIHDRSISVSEAIISSIKEKVYTLDEAKEALLNGHILLNEAVINEWWAIPLQSPLSRSIESSETESILYGAKDSFSEQIDQNITLIRRRLPIMELKSESFTIGSLSKTTVVLLYIEGLTNPDFITIAKEGINNIDYDFFTDSSQVSALMEKGNNSVFPQFQQTDRPDVCARALGIGQLIILVNNTPFALIAPVTLFDLFQSPEDYINRWVVASFLRVIRYVSFFLSIVLIPLYVALTTFHFQMIPLQMLFVLTESRSKLPFTPFWEAFIMLIILEIIKEASLRMPTKAGQTLGVIGGIVIGQASVEAGFASKVLIVLVGIAAIASFLVPNYLLTKANTLIQFILLFLASQLGVIGIAMGLIGILSHLNSLTSLKQPYLAPLAPLYMKDWKDVFIRGPIKTAKERPEYLKPLKKWRTSRRN